MPPGLMNTLQLVNMGSRQADSAMQGMVPNGMQPKGSPQLYIKTVGQIRSEVARLNTIMDGMFREAGTDDLMHNTVQDMMGCIQKLQGIANTLEKRNRELQVDAAQSGAMQMGMGQPAGAMQAPQ